MLDVALGVFTRAAPLCSRNYTLSGVLVFESVERIFVAETRVKSIADLLGRAKGGLRLLMVAM
jgi:predicted RNA-binding protein